MTTTQDFGLGFINFLKAAQERVDREYLASSRNMTPEHIATFKPRLEPMGGPRFIRIVAVSGESRSAFGFIDKQTGDVLKAAGWKAPAKNFARGNIFDDQRGCGRISWTGVH